MTTPRQHTHLCARTRPLTWGVAATAATLIATVLGPTADAQMTSSEGSAASAARGRTTLPDQIGARDRVRQMITVSAKGWGSTSATLKAWRRAPGGTWKLAHGPVRVVVGYNGWVRAQVRVQSTGTTPAGRFELPYAFGRWANPGSKLDYRRVDANDWWPYEPRDPATYNVYQRHKAPRTHWRSDRSERLNSYRRQYGYAIVVGFNLPSGIHYSPGRKQWVAANRADTDRGGGIFLHINGDGLTAGCVSMAAKEMRWLVRWVRPQAHPIVAMGPHDYIVNL